MISGILDAPAAATIAAPTPASVDFCCIFLYVACNMFCYYRMLLSLRLAFDSQLFALWLLCRKLQAASSKCELHHFGVHLSVKLWEFRLIEFIVAFAGFVCLLIRLHKPSAQRVE